jgi:hypothetical protein
MPPVSDRASKYSDGKVVAFPLFTPVEAAYHHSRLLAWLQHDREIPLRRTDWNTVEAGERESAASTSSLYGRYNLGYIKYPRSLPKGYQQVESKNKRCVCLCTLVEVSDIHLIFGQNFGVFFLKKGLSER